MSAHGKTIAEKLDDERWEQLFQKTIEAIDLFGERPDLLSGFVNALKTGKFPASRRATVAGASRTAPRQHRA